MLTPRMTESKKGSETSLLFQQGLAFAILIMIVLMLLYGNRYGRDATLETARPHAKRLNNPWAQIIRPSEWQGGVHGTFFSVYSADRKAGAMLFTEPAHDWLTMAMDVNPERINDLVSNLFKHAGINNDLSISNVHSNEPFQNFATLRFELNGDKNKGVGALWFSHNVRYFYLGYWSDDGSLGERLAVACLDHLSLPPSHDTQLYQRPFTDTREQLDLAKLLDESEARFADGKSLMKVMKSDAGSLQRAMRSFEIALKKAALCATHGARLEQLDDLLNAYRECRTARTQQMNLMKSQILQYKSMGDTKMAKDVARELISSCVLDSELQTKAWAEQQYQLLN